jgi:hypothetical protein
MRHRSALRRTIEVTMVVLLIIGILPIRRTLSSNNIVSPTMAQSSSPRSRPPVYKNSYALVIGESVYPNWPHLPGAKHDAEQVEKILREHGFNVTVKMNPTRSEFNNAIDAIKGMSDRSNPSRFLLYFIGHGYTEKTDIGLDLGYIVPSDAPSPLTDIAGFTAKAISMNTIEAIAKEISPLHALFVFDSCFSGSLFTTMRGIPEGITDRTSYPVRLFITAGTAEQKVPDNSVFCQAFVRGLQGGADRNRDGFITGNELGEFLFDSVANYSQGAQTPRYGKIRDPKLDQGDFVFTLPDKAPSSNTRAGKTSSGADGGFRSFPLESKYYASGWMGDIAGPDSSGKLIFSKQAATVEGKSTVEIRLDYKRGNRGWAGIYWQYPENNWGEKPGLNLVGAKRISFLARGERGGEIVEFISGGIGSDGKPHPDAFKRSLGQIPLNKTWTRYVIDLSDLSEKDLSSVIGAFAWVASGGYDKDDRLVTYIADLKVE